MLIDVRDSLLLVIDVQEKLVPAIHDNTRVIANNRRLLQAATHFGVPAVFTEQYVRGVGHTVAALKEVAVDARYIEKIHFSATRQAHFSETLQSYGRQQLIVTGTESHVCVMQTALGLLREGFNVFLVEDACGSRTPNDKALSMARMRQSGCIIVSSEMVLFEWLERADTEDFRALLPLIKPLLS